MYARAHFNLILSRLKEPRRFIQAILGPRQAGKTFLMRQVIDSLNGPVHYALADEPAVRDRVWIEQQWEIARLRTRERGKAILVLDELQKIEGWSEAVKYLWDSDTATRTELTTVILGSSPLLVQKGLTESLAGRFEVIRLPHWSFAEMRDAFGWDVEQYIFFGSYPGAATLITDEQRWRHYIVDSLIETSISKDILLMKRVDKPALLRRLFYLGCEYSGQILSYQKMLGQLQDAGNTTTLAHYLDLLAGAWMLCGLDKYAEHGVRRRASSPKFQVFNNALMTAPAGISYDGAQNDRNLWGRLVESAVGSHLVNSVEGEVYYWRERGMEVDFVVCLGGKIVGIEVKSGRKKEGLPGMQVFKNNFKPDRLLLVGGDGIALEEFLASPVQHWISY